MSRRLIAIQADLGATTTLHCNDMVVDENGRAYIGEVGFDIHGGAPFKGANLVMVAPESDPVIVASNLACPNGCVITPDGQTIIIAESLANQLTSFQIEEDGTLTNMRIWAKTDRYSPDGICLDSEGAIWMACPLQGCVLRIFEGGRITNKIKTDPMPLACMLGGPSRNLLFICEALHPDQATKTMAGGCIEIVEVDVPGVGLP